MDEIYLIMIKLTLTMVLTGIIGLEREITGHKAGIRTLILVGVGASSFVMVADQINIPESEMGRIIAGVATGLGFLGAGAIIKEGLNVKGLTTAATIWVSASIGVAVGSGAFNVSIITFFFTFFVLTIFAILEKKLDLKPDSGTLSITMGKGHSIPSKELSRMQRGGIVVQRLSLDDSGKKTRIEMDIEIPRSISIADLVERTGRIGGIEKVEWEDLAKGGPISYLDRIR